MTKVTTTKAKLLFVEQSEDGGFNIPIIPGYNVYVILFETKQATEEDWKGVVDEWWQYNTITGTPVPVNIIGYKDYDIEAKDYDMVFTATESGLSLQKAHGLDVNKNYAVIECKL